MSLPKQRGGVLKTGAANPKCVSRS